MAKVIFNRLFNCIALITVLLSVYSCAGKTQEDIVPSPEYAAYVSAYTGGVVSQSSAIRVELTQDLPVVELNTELAKNPFTFSPGIKGSAYWTSNNTIEFVPEEGALKPGQLYKATFKLDDYVTVSKELNKFEFTFRVMERNYSVDVDAISVAASHPEHVTVTGNIRFSDVVKKEQVEKMVAAKASGNIKLDVVVQPTDNAAVYHFAINNVSKESKETEVKITINGKAIGADSETNHVVVIPARESFTYLSAQRVYHPDAGIQLLFSEAVSTTQDLNGLIVVEGVSSPVFQVEDNKVIIFFEANNREYLSVNIHQGIQSASGKKLEESASVSFSQDYIKPEVSWLNNTGTIMPDSKNLIVSFKAVSLHAVDLSVIRIFENNILSFLQTNSLSSSNELRRSGRLAYQQMLRLDNDPTKDIYNWEEYSIDLSGLIEQEPGAIYRIILSFKQDYSAYPCGSSGATKLVSEAVSQMKKVIPESTGLDDSAWDVPYTYYYMENEGYDWRVYDWSQRNNPCHPSYFMSSERKISCNVLATNLGVIAKQNSAGKLWVTVNNILDTTPVASADVTVYNFQLQPIGSGKTDSNGFAEFECKGVPFAVVATDGKQKTYLKLIDGEELSVSRFDVGGKEIAKGLKGFVYGERGVWRPGDTLHVSFILDDAQKRIPAKHPVSFELFNPRGQFYTKLISTQSINGFHSFHVPTSPDDPTGLWNSYIKVGGATFHKSFRIETVKPNRLKINLDIPGNFINASQGNVSLKLSSSWLTGATASSLKAKVEMSLARMNTQFKNYTQYIFNNPATDFSSNKTDVFDGALDAQGNTSFTLKVPEAKNAPGLLRANITTRVFEPGGDASINTVAVPFSPFSSYVGINLNQPKSRYIETDKDHVFDVVTVDSEGNPVNRSNLEYKVYRIGWSWWWEKRNESFSSYINNSSIVPEVSGTLKTVNGKAQFTFRIDYPKWGRYLVYVKDKESGHATGGTVYIDWPDWRGRSNKTDPSGITMLAFSVDKELYNMDETVTAIVPAASDGRALVTIENGSNILKREWIQVSSSTDTKYQFKVTPGMAPNVYLHIMMLQPHAQTVNDLPIRMYGVVPVFVTDKATVLEPQIKMPDVLRPETEFDVTVNEKNGKSMTYTLAIVDDGLLDLTNFKTPDPWNEFYAREALGIRTWDMYDEVIGAYSGSYSSLFSVGGDEMLKQEDAKANRFRPVVKYYGPFMLDKGKSNTHKIALPMYVGSVRTMVVAGENGAYGKAEKTTPVRTPLMLLSTLPRVLSTGEEIWLPVNVFAMEDAIKNVTVSVETSANLKLTEGSKQSVAFAKAGDKLVYFKLKTGDETGVATVHITATGNGQTTKESIEIEIRNPNPVVTLQENKLIGAGEKAQLSYALGNVSKESWVRLEVARIPSVDISRRFDYLYSYQHCCSEQLTSKALPLLFITQFKDTEPRELENIKKNIQDAIKHLYARQLSNGGIVYWPGNATADEWITSYAGMFLVMAQEKGYEVNPGVLNKWKAYQREAAKNWSADNRNPDWYYWQSDLSQAYRLYTLALAGSPELGAMNRLKEMKELSMQARWRLAAAYALAGKETAANELIFNASAVVDAYSSDNMVYGSPARDEAMILEALVLLGKDKEAFEQARKVSDNLNRESYFSTQSTAYSLMSMGRLAEKLSGSLDFGWKLNGTDKSEVHSAKAIHLAELPTNPSSGTVEISNKGKGAIYANLVSRTQLLKDTLPQIANNLRVEVKYTDMAGKPLQVGSLTQGTDFVAVVTVSNISGTTNYKDIALTHIIPSGWEIYNERMVIGDDSAEPGKKKESYTYRDIRDDRVLTYFDLARGHSQTFPIRLQATYAGTFILPAIQCEAMYDVQAQGRTKAGVVTVGK
ncbi:alpha-2-macroglobulin [Bacteroides sp. OttesenSCG-928-D19]|nr:alpha-2-macroglobulin [Bacteroides sp. OttesenSCG-928-N06]MDL2305736.1 alpha-2-macroglobulin [Bacteroides sp. OttesenSCG-928-D19]